MLMFKSLRNRKLTVGFTVASIALSVCLLLGVERIRHEARNGFTQTISGTDLIVGARTSPVQLLLSSVFRLGDATNNIEWESFLSISTLPAVEWAIPISLGDSHRGYRVLGTTSAYLDHLQYGNRQPLTMAEGSWSHRSNEAVLGAQVAKSLGYGLGDALVVAHGAGDVSFVKHDTHPFQVSGILKPTGTPVDQTIHISLEGMDAIHADMSPQPGEEELDPLAAALAKRNADPDHGHDHEGHACTHPDHHPGTITAFFVGLKARNAVLGMQRDVSEFEPEPLSAAIPALALQELWEVVGVVERASLAVSGFVVVVGLSGMLVALTTSLNERRREMAILRSVGARPTTVFGLILGEAMLMTAMGILCGVTLLYGLLAAARPILSDRLGLQLSMGVPSPVEWGWMLVVFGAGSLVGLIPARQMVRAALKDGLSIQI